MAPDRTFHHGPRRLPRTKARESALGGYTAVSRIQRPLKAVLVDFNLKLNAALREPFEGYLHRAKSFLPNEYSKRPGSRRGVRWER
jgi:hypothetical protein